MPSSLRGGARQGSRTTRSGSAAAKSMRPYVLRYVAGRCSWRPSNQQTGDGIAIDALVALAADGDQDAAIDARTRRCRSRRSRRRRALASMGSTQAVKALIAQLDSTPGSKTPVINALGASGTSWRCRLSKALLADPERPQSRRAPPRRSASWARPKRFATSFAVAEGPGLHRQVESGRCAVTA